TVPDYLRGLLRRRAGLVVTVTLANALAAAAGLAVPLLLGRLVDTMVESSGRPVPGTITTFVLVVTGVLVAQAVLTFLAKWLAAVLGHGVLAEEREHVVRAVLRLPLG